MKPLYYVRSMIQDHREYLRERVVRMQNTIKVLDAVYKRLEGMDSISEADAKILADMLRMELKRMLKRLQQQDQSD